MNSMDDLIDFMKTLFKGTFYLFLIIVFAIFTSIAIMMIHFDEFSDEKSKCYLHTPDGEDCIVRLHRVKKE